MRIFKRDEVDITRIIRRESYSRNYRGKRQITLDAADYLEDNDWYGTKALDFAKSSSEVLFYHRIYPKDIVETITWRQDDELPDDLPEAFLKPRKARYGRNWLDWVVWEKSDPYHVAMRKVRDRREQLEISRRV